MYDIFFIKRVKHFVCYAPFLSDYLSQFIAYSPLL